MTGIELTSTKRGDSHAQLQARVRQLGIREFRKTRLNRAFGDGLWILACYYAEATDLDTKRVGIFTPDEITQVRKSVTIDWTLRQSARAKIRVMV